MGYPMTWWRLVHRNQLTGNYTAFTEDTTEQARQLIRGDMRRLEEDSRDEKHLKWAAEVANITPEQAKIVLDWFFRDSNIPFSPAPEFLRQEHLPPLD